MTVKKDPAKEEKSSLMFSPRTIVWAATSVFPALVWLLNSYMTKETRFANIEKDKTVNEIEHASFKTAIHDLETFVYRKN